MSDPPTSPGASRETADVAAGNGGRATAAKHAATPSPTSADLPATASDFAPANPTDGRDLFEYKSRWSEEARKAQTREGVYLGALWLLGLAGIGSLLLWTSVDTTPGVATSIGVVFCGGLLGGTTFDVKWWYHSIAKGLWHLDRRAWRVAVPWVAAIVAAFAHVLFKSQLLGFLNSAAADNVYNMLAFGFLLGYFSDSAVAKLAEVAELLFGASRGHRTAADNRDSD